MPDTRVRPSGDGNTTTRCDACGREAVFRDDHGRALCEACPIFEYGERRGRTLAYTEVLVASVSSILAGGVAAADMHRLVDVLAEQPCVNAAEVPAEAGLSNERVSDGPWLATLTATSGHGEAIQATYRGAGR